MTNIFKTGLMTSVIALSMSTTASFAQEADAAADNAEEGAIIVTARRQDERLIDVPASISVLDADALAKTGVVNAEGFANLTAGVTIVSGTAEAGDTQINIRGINGARDAESSVALVVDGILKTNTAQLNQTQGTLRQIEILKGPQGAIYGRNAAAGAIVVSTLKPGADLEGGAKVSYASENTIESSAYASIPFSEGTGLVLSTYYKTSDGFYTNEFLNRDVVDDQRVWALDGRFVAQLGEATELDVKARYSDISGASINFNSIFHIPALGGAFFEDVNDHEFNYFGNIRPTNEQSSFDISAKIEHEFDSVTLTAWALYSDIDQELTADGTSADFARFISAANPAAQGAVDACFASTAANTGFPINAPGFIGANPVPFIFDFAGSTFGAYSPTTCDGTQFQTRNQKDFSGEIRLASNDGGPLSWQIGAYYLNIDREVGVSIGADTGAGVTRQLFNAADSSNPTSLLLADAFNTNVYAAFGSVEYELSDNLTAGLALRYDIEDRESESLVPNATDPFTGGFINPGQAFGPLTPQSETFRQLQPKISISWQPNDQFNIFANWGIGFKSGGFNNQGSAAIVDTNFNAVPDINAGVTITDQYDKEVSSAFELGVKGSLFDNRIKFDLAGYYTQIDDMQFFEFFVGSFGLLRTVSNIDEVEVLGAELNVNATIIEGWDIFGSFNVTDSEINENSSRPDTVGNKSPYTADYTINLGTQFDMPITDGVNGIFRADYRITGPTYFHTVQDQVRPTIFSALLPGSLFAAPPVVGNADYSAARRDAFGVMNGRIGLEGENWNLAVFAENLFNKAYLNEVIPAIEFGGSFASPGGQRLIGVEGGFKF